jgi:hypothetical protein
VSEKRSATHALLLLLARSSRLDSTRLDTTRHDARTPRFAELSLGALARLPPHIPEIRSLLHPERRRAPANGRAGLRNHSPLRSFTGEGELGFWEALCATAQALHHGSSSFQVGRCSLPPSSLPSASTGLLQRCHQQRYCNDYICKRAVRAVYYSLSVHHVLRVHVSLLLVFVHLAV